MHPGTPQTKSEWRRKLLAVRAAIPEPTRRIASRDIATRVCALAAFGGARTILGYVALGAEVDPSVILAAAAVRRVDIFLPLATGPAPHLRWVRYGDGGTTEDPGTTVAALGYPILAVVPGVGFDPFGTRLGRGGGFYDRALAALRGAGQIQVVGLAFECQIVPVLPTDAWDEPVEFVASECRVVTAGPQSRGEARTR